MRGRTTQHPWSMRTTPGYNGRTVFTTRRSTLVAAVAVWLWGVAPSPEAAGGVAPAERYGALRPEVFDLASRAVACAERAGVISQPRTLTVIDYSRPSSERRLWTIDLDRQALVHEELVSHGKGSGDLYAERFSNTEGSYQTSLGLFVTGETYVGQNGYSLRLDGVEPGLNDQARARAIVMHGAPYVSDTFVAGTGRLGRSLGCPAVRTEIAKSLIDRIKGGNVLFAYGDDAEWLKTSAYLGTCTAASRPGFAQLLRESQR